MESKLQSSCDAPFFRAAIRDFDKLRLSDLRWLPVKYTLFCGGGRKRFHHRESYRGPPVAMSSVQIPPLPITPAV